MDEDIIITMKKREDKKHSVRFDPEDKDNGVLAGLYLLNAANESLGKPERIEVVVRRAKK